MEIIKIQTPTENQAVQFKTGLILTRAMIERLTGFQKEDSNGECGIDEQSELIHEIMNVIIDLEEGYIDSESPEPIYTAIRRLRDIEHDYESFRFSPDAQGES